MNYPDSVRFLYSLGNEMKTAKLGLDRMLGLLEALDNPQRAGRFVHVAGTNGKGSVSAMIASGLRAAGLRTGLYTSPHLVEPTERVQIDGTPVSREEFTSAFGRVHKCAERLMRDGRLEFHPTYFETVTAMAFLLFRDHAVDTAVLEVGLGGRLDATNVIQPALAVITPVDFDHEAFLGKSLEAIAGEKAGILKSGAPAVFAPQRPEALATLDQVAQERQVSVEHAADWTIDELELRPDGSRFRAAGRHIYRIDCPLAGEHQVTNALTAVVALDRIGIRREAIEQGIRETRWPGRLEKVAARPDVYLDGAHNPAGARALAAYIRRFHGGRRVWMVYGAMRDKAVEEVAGILFPLAQDLILTRPQQARALRPGVLAEMADHSRSQIAPGLQVALERVRQAAPEDVVFITGSLFLVGEARALLVTGRPG